MNKEQRLRIYGRSRENMYEKELRRLEEDGLSDRNKELIKSFQNSLFSKGCSELRVAKLSSQLRRICEILNKDLDKAEKTDIETLLAYYYKKEDYSDVTKSDYSRVLKQFYRWFEDEDRRVYNGTLETRERARRFYKFVLNIKVNGKPKKRNAEDLILDNDIDLAIKKGTNSFKDKAFLKVLHETGMRCSEILSIKIKDLVFEGNIAKLRVPEMKTEERTIPIVHSLGYLQKWLEIHPCYNKESFIFVGESRKHGAKPLTRCGAQKIVNRCFEKANLKKRHNLHWFRHSRATLLAPHLTEVLLCKYMGWVIGSKQVKTYVHLKEDQLDQVYCNISGIQKTEVKESKKQLRKCVCGCMNENIARYCYRCGQPLDVSVLIKEEDITQIEQNNEFSTEMDKSLKLLMEIAQNPNLMQKFEEFKKKLKNDSYS